MMESDVQTELNKNVVLQSFRYKQQQELDSETSFTDPSGVNQHNSSSPIVSCNNESQQKPQDDEPQQSSHISRLSSFSELTKRPVKYLRSLSSPSEQNNNSHANQSRILSRLATSPNLYKTSSIGHHITSDAFKFGIEVSDLYHSYDGEEKVLRGLTMKVEHGSIYGLLGASGCGKTTLLKCIIGMMVPDSGFIDVFGRKPRDPDSGIPGRVVGYMPQDVALYNDLTIEEILIYFGRLYFMERQLMMDQIDYLIAMLDLPSRHRLISTLSGGQMRRVSFAAALIHEPPLVILDEPTAGVDPMLRSNIWKHLNNICKKSKVTIIITTHYIEEARQADKVGLMRRGQLLAEASPKSLMRRFNLATLEDVFLELCTRIESKKMTSTVYEEDLHAEDNYDETDEDRMMRKRDEDENTENICSYHEKAVDVEGIQQPSSASMIRGRVNAAFVNDRNDDLNNNTAGGNNHLRHQDSNDDQMKQQIISSNRNMNSVARKRHFQKIQRAMSLRNTTKVQRLKGWWSVWWSMFCTLMWKNYIRSLRHPLLLAFQYILPVVQIILFCICIGGDPFDIKVAIVNEESPPYLSSIFIKNLDPYFIEQHNFTDLDEAREEVKRNRLWGVIHIQSNFSDALIARLNAHNVGDPDNQTIEESKVLIYADLTDRLISLTVERSLEESYQDFVKEVLKDEFSVSPQLATLPIVLKDPIYGSYKHREHKGYREYMAPGILLSIAFSMAYAVTSLVLILEREEKTFERNFVTGLTPSQVIIAHTFIRMVFMLAQAFLLLLMTVYLFNIPSRGPIMAAIFLLMTQNIAGIAYGMLLSATFEKTHTAAIVAIGTIFFIFFVSGVLWPVQAIPKWMRWFSNLQPCTVPIDTLRSILSRGWGFSDINVWKGYGVSLLWTFILFCVSIYNYKYF